MPAGSDLVGGERGCNRLPFARRFGQVFSGARSRGAGDEMQPRPLKRFKRLVRYLLLRVVFALFGLLPLRV
ncbi:MAG TPA: hypothetical protein DFS52_24175, partial [Myxococcales bacterium]|nr:hypothetical protein [Myxococcales bacterium]